ncbi:hypothetical protein ROHU_000082 [Labeo rohita]|uniref:Uncharacterized protein n=1 Tax=Labeo rohita TaxID=84645 RepID=A0A498P5N9_LABRO|nr:hypothetical protein ROHU_000082 [Labeo rohita]
MQLCCTGRESSSCDDVADGGLPLRPKGAAALLHWEGESHLLQSAQRNSNRRQTGDSCCDRREPRLCCTGKESLICCRVHSVTPTDDRRGTHAATEGAVALLHRKGEPRPLLDVQMRFEMTALGFGL